MFNFKSNRGGRYRHLDGHRDEEDGSHGELPRRHSHRGRLLMGVFWTAVILFLFYIFSDSSSNPTEPTPALLTDIWSSNAENDKEYFNSIYMDDEETDLDPFEQDSEPADPLTTLTTSILPLESPPSFSSQQDDSDYSGIFEDPMENPSTTSKSEEFSDDFINNPVDEFVDDSNIGDPVDDSTEESVSDSAISPIDLADNPVDDLVEDNLDVDDSIDDPIDEIIDDSISDPVNDIVDNSANKSNGNLVTISPDERFVLLVGLREQETKAQLHMRSVSFLSGLVNRTLVIPNVAGSRIGSCLKHPFSSYYESEKWLSTYKNYFKYITQTQFEDWLAEQEKLGHKPTGQNVRIGGTTTQRQNEEILMCEREWVKSNKFDTKGKYSERRVLDLTKKMAMGTSLDGGSSKATKVIVNFMNEIDAQVMMLQFGPANKWLAMPQAYDLIPYNNELKVRSDTILDFVKPSIVVHWRMETVPSKDIPHCAHVLVDYIKELRQTMKFNHIYFMTDFPLIRGRLRSYTFKTDEYHAKAIDILKENLNLTSSYYEDKSKSRPANVTNPMTGTTMTFLPVYPVEDARDAGQLGIVEKLVAQNARYFSAGYYRRDDKCAKKSNYVMQIEKERRARWVSEKHLRPSQRSLMNVVDYWGK